MVYVNTELVGRDCVQLTFVEEEDNKHDKVVVFRLSANRTALIKMCGDLTLLCLSGLARRLISDS